MNNYSPITISTPGTCGELVQGWHPGWEMPVLVSCPIEVYSRVTVTRRADGRLVTPRGLSKLRDAAELARQYLTEAGAGATFRVASRLQVGRGMASSTADMVGAMAGLALALNRPLPPAELARLACRVEPTDSIMFTELTMLAYRDTGRSQPIGPAPALPLLMLDPGQAVDTLSFNRALNLAALRQLGPTTLEALDWLRQGTQTGDAAAIGAAATLSAVSYQPLLFNPLLDSARQWAAETGAVGVVRAHSGSLIGLLYPPGAPLDGPARWLEARFAGAITATQLTGGGYRLESAPAARLAIAPVYQMEGVL